MKYVALMLLVVNLTGCATIRRHPKLTGAAVGLAIAVPYAIVTFQHSCTYMYEGKPYNGTTCPAPKAEASFKK